MSVADELFKIADNMQEQANVLVNEKFQAPLQKLMDVAERVGRSWSGSWLGYHSRIYYDGLADPPLGARFSQEWGMMDTFGIQHTIGAWREYRFDDVVDAIRRGAGNPDISDQEGLSEAAERDFEDAQSNTLSLLTGAVEDRKMTNF